MSAQKKTKTVNLRMDPEDHALITRAAEVCGKSLTAFMTEASVHSAQEKLVDQWFIGVSADVFAAVSDQLAAPGVARDQLVKLFESKIDWMDCDLPYRKPAPLSDQHTFDGFNSGKPALDEWLRDLAWYNQEQNYTCTFVIADENYRVVGYHSLCAGMIHRNGLPRAVKGSRAPQEIPVGSWQDWP